MHIGRPPPPPPKAVLLLVSREERHARPSEMQRVGAGELVLGERKALSRATLGKCRLPGGGDRTREPWREIPVSQAFLCSAASQPPSPAVVPCWGQSVRKDGSLAPVRGSTGAHCELWDRPQAGTKGGSGLRWGRHCPAGRRQGPGPEPQDVPPPVCSLTNHTSLFP